MSYFPRHESWLHAEQVPIQTIAEDLGTPTYLYSATALIAQFRAFTKALSHRQHLICFAVKANSNLAVLNLLAQEECGFDIVSGGELARVLKAGGDPKRVVFSGIGKSAEEMTTALKHKIRCFNVESEAEWHLLRQIAAHHNCQAPIAFRVNPDIDPQTHPNIATGLKQHKFGIPAEEALALYQQAADCPNTRIQGIACHIGSQITDLSPFEKAFGKMEELIKKLNAQGITLPDVNFGGGLGIPYPNASPPTLEDYAALASQFCQQPNTTLIIEPGRAIAAMAGLLITKVLYLKSNGEKTFCIVDAGMNDLMRPALYGATQEIVPIQMRDSPPQIMDVVGPICESSDILGKDRLLSVQPGDLLAVMQAGAYGFSMSSQYNSRPRSAEVLIKGESFKVVRPRETIEGLFEKECHFI